MHIYVCIFCWEPEQESVATCKHSFHSSNISSSKPKMLLKNLIFLSSFYLYKFPAKIFRGLQLANLISLSICKTTFKFCPKFCNSAHLCILLKVHAHIHTQSSQEKNILFFYDPLMNLALKKCILHKQVFLKFLNDFCMNCGT